MYVSLIVPTDDSQPKPNALIRLVKPTCLCESTSYSLPGHRTRIAVAGEEGQDVSRLAGAGGLLRSWVSTHIINDSEGMEKKEEVVRLTFFSHLLLLLPPELPLELLE